MADKTKSRIMMIDLDDTLLVWTDKGMGFAAPAADEFMLWALEHFEVRWLTMWCPSGKLREHGARELSYRFGHRIPPEVFAGISNPKRFINNKTEAVDHDDSRPWVWVEDALVPYELKELQDKNCMENFYPTNVTHNVVALQATWAKLAKRFNLPKPKTPYSTKIIYPNVILSDTDMMTEFRNGKMQNHDAERPPEPGLWP